MDNRKLAEIKKRAEAATEGPWYRQFGYGINIVSESDYKVIDEDGGVSKYPDATFIEHARQDVPALLAEVERLQAENEILESFFEESERNKNRYADEMLVFRIYAEKFADVLEKTYVGLEFPEYKEFRKLIGGDSDD